MIKLTLEIPRNKDVICVGNEIGATQRSAMAKHRNNSFVGGRTEYTLGREISIKRFPRNVKMANKMFKAMRKRAKFTGINPTVSSLLVV